MIVLSIDPSLRRLGWATFNDQQGHKEMLGTSAWDFGTLSPRVAGRRERMDRVRSFFDQKRLTDVNQLVYEEPSYFSSPRGAIALKEGYLTDLGIVIGIAIGTFPKAQIWSYKPQTWKGSVPKEVTYKKWLRTFVDSSKYCDKVNHDLIDAIMLLHYHLKQVNIG